MTTLADVRAAMATAVDTISGLTAYAYESDSITQVPAVYIHRGQFTPDLVLSGTKQSYTFTLNLYVERVLERQAQITLDAFCDMAGSLSIRTALENDALYTPGLVHYVNVRSIGPTAEAVVAGVAYFVVQFDVEVVW